MLMVGKNPTEDGLRTFEAMAGVVYKPSAVKSVVDPNHETMIPCFLDSVQ